MANLLAQGVYFNVEASVIVSKSKAIPIYHTHVKIIIFFKWVEILPRVPLQMLTGMWTY